MAPSRMPPGYADARYGHCDAPPPTRSPYPENGANYYGHGHSHPSTAHIHQQNPHVRHEGSPHMMHPHELQHPQPSKMARGSGMDADAHSPVESYSNYAPLYSRPSMSTSESPRLAEPLPYSARYDYPPAGPLFSPPSRIRQNDSLRPRSPLSRSSMTLDCGGSLYEGDASACFSPTPRNGGVYLKEPYSVSSGHLHERGAPRFQPMHAYSSERYPSHLLSPMPPSPPPPPPPPQPLQSPRYSNGQMSSTASSPNARAFPMAPLTVEPQSCRDGKPSRKTIKAHLNSFWEKGTTLLKRTRTKAPVAPLPVNMEDSMFSASAQNVIRHRQVSKSPHYVTQTISFVSPQEELSQRPQARRPEFMHFVEDDRLSLNQRHLRNSTSRLDHHQGHRFSNVRYYDQLKNGRFPDGGSCSLTNLSPSSHLNGSANALDKLRFSNSSAASPSPSQMKNSRSHSSYFPKVETVEYVEDGSSSFGDYFDVLKGSLAGIFSNRLLRLSIACVILVLLSLGLEHVWIARTISDFQAGDGDSFHLALASDLSINDDVGKNSLERALRRHFVAKNILEAFSGTKFPIIFLGDSIETKSSGYYADDSIHALTEYLSNYSTGQAHLLMGAKDLFSYDLRLEEKEWIDQRKRNNNIWSFNDQMVRLAHVEAVFGPMTRVLTFHLTSKEDLVKFKATNNVKFGNATASNEGEFNVLFLNSVLPAEYLLAQLGETITEIELARLIERGFVAPSPYSSKPPTPPKAIFPASAIPKDLLCLSYYGLNGLDERLSEWMTEHCSVVLYREHADSRSDVNLFNVENSVPQYQIFSSNSFHSADAKVGLFTLTPDEQEPYYSSSNTRMNKPAKLMASFKSYSLPRPHILLLFIWTTWVVVLLAVLILPKFSNLDSTDGDIVATPHFVNSLSFHDEKIQNLEAFSLRNRFKMLFVLMPPRRTELIVKYGIFSFVATIILLTLMFTHCHTAFLNILPVLFIIAALLAISSPWPLSMLILSIYGLFILCSTFIS